ncbi:unnamed protein product [Brachionus calyciflorus]|uniref:C-type lectin domain-containing protein n=1 Tax=Brachionus calyciflorus TaxID=104777 RepID=A0A813M0P4_9BILA|nr:unnamed protein product [Brachionus calyciflorus]
MIRKLILLCIIKLILCEEQQQPLPSPNYGRVFINTTSNFQSDKRVLTCSGPASYGFVQRAGTNKYYATADLQMNWVDAQNYCQSFGANLPVASRASDTDFFRWFVGGKFMTLSYHIFGITEHNFSGYWLGMYKSLETKSWKWIDNSPFIYSDWDTAQPDGDRFSRIEHFAFDLYDIGSKKHRGWHDWVITGYNLVLCELKC